jgi:hypothetical protein
VPAVAVLAFVFIFVFVFVFGLFATACFFSNGAGGNEPMTALVAIPPVGVAVSFKFVDEWNDGGSESDVANATAAGRFRGDIVTLRRLALSVVDTLAVIGSDGVITGGGGMNVGGGSAIGKLTADEVGVAVPVPVAPGPIAPTGNGVITGTVGVGGSE